MTVKEIIDLSTSTNTPKKKVETPLTVKKDDVEPPLKKSKTNSGLAVITSTATTAKKSKGKKICDGCEKVEEPQLHAQRYPKDGKSYCFGCHVFKNNCCGHKPPTGGRICYQKWENKENWLCSNHQYTLHTSEISYDSMDES